MRAAMRNASGNTVRRSNWTQMMFGFTKLLATLTSGRAFNARPSPNGVLR